MRAIKVDDGEVDKEVSHTTSDIGSNNVILYN
jgi:hypothetical protein